MTENDNIYQNNNEFSVSELIDELESRYIMPTSSIPFELHNPFISFIGSKLNNEQDSSDLDDFFKVETHLSEPSLLLPKVDDEFINEDMGRGSRLEVRLDFRDGTLCGIDEVRVTANSNMASKKVGSNYIRGSYGQSIFIPGGFLEEKFNKQVEIEQLIESLEFGEDKTMLSCLPGMDRGLFYEENIEEKDHKLKEKDNRLDLDVILYGDEDEFDFLYENQVLNESKEEQSKEEDKEEDNEINESQEKQEEIDNELQSIVPEKEVQLIQPSTINQIKQTEWAHQVELNKIPLDYNTVVSKLAHEYPFELDPFQKHAVYHLEKNESVFVAAHTSAGKTVVAEYAIALSQRHMTRTIYTSPIKALSNQKFRDFKDVFEDVGILTGDVQINPEASCLIMTTEILRSMLYRGADAIRDVEFVVFDEVHYLNDLERGVVWEEVIILLPSHITIILLSATVPNTMEFAEWVGRTKRKNIFVITTLQRPIPLEHYIYAEKELFKIVDKNKTFIEVGWKDAKNALLGNDPTKPPIGGKQNNTKGRGGGVQRGQGTRQAVQSRAIELSRGGNASRSSHFDKQQQNLWVHMIGFLKKKDLLPVIIFTFSKKRCDSNADSLSNIDLSTNSEKSQIQVFITKALNKLNPTDRRLPQLVWIAQLLRRGISVHHSGLLPVVKEMVEILFSKGLVKVLFATETFAMGVNMPARSVVFSSVKKHDGMELRYLNSGEYTQMSGRAGRRGLDKVGMVILACPEGTPPDMASLKSIILGKSNRLNSQFRLTFNMILNLLRVETLKIEDMIQRSFAEDPNMQKRPEQEELQLQLINQLNQLERIHCESCSDLDSFLEVDYQLRNYGKQLIELNIKEMKGGLNSGRVVIVDMEKYRNVLGVIVKLNSEKGKYLISNNRVNNINTYSIFVLLDNKTEFLRALPYGWIRNINEPSYDIIDVDIGQLSHVTNFTLDIKNNLINNRDKLETMKLKDKLVELTQQFITFKSNESNLYLPKHKNPSLNYHEINERHTNLLEKAQTYQCMKCSDFDFHFEMGFKRSQLERELERVNQLLDGVDLALLPEYHQRLDALKVLGFTDGRHVTLKGRVGCEINSINELIVTELILNNFFSNFEPEEAVALLSPFLFEEKNLYPTEHQDDPYMTPNLKEGCSELLATAYKVGTTLLDCSLSISLDDYTQLNMRLVPVVYEWARGMSFHHIASITDVAEGTIVRTITRLDDACRDVRNAARLIGDPELYQKMESARELIKRDIVFAQSLYF